MYCACQISIPYFEIVFKVYFVIDALKKDLFTYIILKPKNIEHHSICTIKTTTNNKTEEKYNFYKMQSTLLGPPTNCHCPFHT